MLVSWNWLKKYVSLDMTLAELEDRLSMSGLNHEGTRPVGDDLAIDLEVASNRPDCLGHIGVAREIAVLWQQPITLPDPQPGNSAAGVDEHASVKIECPELCPRYTARVVHGVSIGPSPDWLVDHLLMGICATQLGVTEQALRMTAGYTSEREQFGRPLATFQAVTQRLADQFVNVGGIRLATLSAAWRLAQGLDAREDLLIAKWWASERATEVAHATQHCHGGMGVAKDYPLHRYTLWNKHLTTSLGAGTQSLRSLGGLLAEA